MIRLQIVERSGANLFSTLKRAMRSKELQTFSLAQGGRRVVHVNYPGWMNWSASPGAIQCEIVNPREPGTEWRLLHAFIGRLADRYAGLVHSVSIDFPSMAAAGARVRARRGAVRASGARRRLARRVRVAKRRVRRVLRRVALRTRLKRRVRRAAPKRKVARRAARRATPKRTARRSPRVRAAARRTKRPVRRAVRRGARRAARRRTRRAPARRRRS
jgi:hypothetical protein